MSPIEESLKRIERTLEKIYNILAVSGKDVMNTNEVAEYLGITAGRVRALIHEGNIPYHKNESLTRNFFRRDEIDSWRMSRRIKTNSELQQEI